MSDAGTRPDQPSSPYPKPSPAVSHEQRLEDLKRDGGMEEAQFSLFRGRPVQEGFAEVAFRWPVEYYEEFRRLGVEIGPW